MHLGRVLDGLLRRADAFLYGDDRALIALSAASVARETLALLVTEIAEVGDVVPAREREGRSAFRHRDRFEAWRSASSR